MLRPLIQNVPQAVGGPIIGSTGAFSGAVTVGTLNGVTWLTGSAIPSDGAGVAATRPAMYLRTGTDEVWQKTGSGDTAWTYVGPDAATSRLLGNPEPYTTGSLTCTADTMYAYYIGTPRKYLTAIDAGFYVHGVAAAGAGWAEIAIATGVFASARQASVDLSIRGYASIDGEVKTASTDGYAKSLTGLANISPSSDLWLLVACNYATTQASFRIIGEGDQAGVGRRRVGGGRPSLNLNTPLAFAYTSSQAYPMLWGHLT